MQDKCLVSVVENKCYFTCVNGLLNPVKEVNRKDSPRTIKKGKPKPKNWKFMAAHINNFN